MPDDVKAKILSLQDCFKNALETICELENRVQPTNRGYIYQIRKSLESLQKLETK